MKFEYEARWSLLSLLKSSNIPVNIIKLTPNLKYNENMLFFSIINHKFTQNTQKINDLENSNYKPIFNMKVVNINGFMEG